MSYNGPINPTRGQFPISLYGYVPNHGANIFAAIVWGFVLIPHVWWLVAKKGKMIQGFIIFGCLWQIIAYSIRAASFYSTFAYGLFIAQYVILQVSPVFFISALIYALCWAMRSEGSSNGYKRFRPLYLFPAMQIFNMIAFVLLTIGSTLYAIGLGRQIARRNVGYSTRASRNVLIAGQSMMLASLVFILIILTDLLIHFKRDKTLMAQQSVDPIITPLPLTPGPLVASPLSTVPSSGTNTTAVDHAFVPLPLSATPVIIPQAGRAITTLFLGIAWSTSGMLLTRTCFRLAETALNVFAVSWSSQALFGIFEFGVVWSTLVIWACMPFAIQLEPEVAYVPPVPISKSRA